MTAEALSRARCKPSKRAFKFGEKAFAISDDVPDAGDRNGKADWRRFRLWPKSQTCPGGERFFLFHHTLHQRLEACPDKAKTAHPITDLDAKDSPVLIQHGDADISVSPKQAQKFHDALRAAKVPAELVIYPGADHGFTKPDGGPHDAVNRQALDKVFVFLEGLFPKPR